MATDRDSPPTRTRAERERTETRTPRKRAEIAARQAVRVAGRATSSLRMLPSFLVVGAQRSGTTSLHRALARHPQVIAPALHKGVHFFDVDYARGVNWYRGQFPLHSVAALRTRRVGPPVTGESSPYYMFHPAGPARMAAVVPNAKLIVLVRDPVERAWSAYTHEFRRGFETETFERALELEPARLAGEEERLLSDPSYVSHAHRHQAYLARGRYADQIERLHEHFPREQVLVVDFAQLSEEPDEALRRVTEFVGLAPWQPDRLEKANPRPRTDLAPALRRRLEAQFDEDDRRLADLLGAVPSWRR
jgi:hypothetical protein